MDGVDITVIVVIAVVIAVIVIEIDYLFNVKLIDRRRHRLVFIAGCGDCGGNRGERRMWLLYHVEKLCTRVVVERL